MIDLLKSAVKEWIVFQTPEQEEKLANDWIEANEDKIKEAYRKIWEDGRNRGEHSGYDYDPMRGDSVDFETYYKTLRK